jgi:hypothetical protein
MPLIKEILVRGTYSMPGTAAEARAMVKSYLALETGARPEDQSHYRSMADWWRKRAAELGAVEKSVAKPTTFSLSKADT